MFDRTLRFIVTALVAHIEQFHFTHPSVALRQIADTFQSATGGTTGAVRTARENKRLQIYALLLTGACRRLNLAPIVDAQTIVDAIREGMRSVSQYSKANVGDRTLVSLHFAFMHFQLDSINAIVVEMESNAGDFTLASIAQVGRYFTDQLEMFQAVEQAADATSRMVARAGRASYVAADKITRPDAGAMAVAICMRAIVP